MCKTGPGETESVTTGHDWCLPYNGVNLHVFTKLLPFGDFHSLLRWNRLLQAECTQMISLHKVIRVHKSMTSQGKLCWCHIKNTYVWIYDSLFCKSYSIMLLLPRWPLAARPPHVRFLFVGTVALNFAHFLQVTFSSLSSYLQNQILYPATRGW